VSPPLDPPQPKPLHLSWSRLRDWEECQHRVWQKMQPGFQKPRIDGRNFLAGTLADRAMRRWLELPNPQSGQMATIVDDLWDEHAENSTEYTIRWRGDPKADRRKVRELAKRVVTNVEPFLIARVLPNDYHPEMRFRAPLDIPGLHGERRRIYLVGGIDIAVREASDAPKPERRVWLYDLKATEDDNYVRHATMMQLVFYSIAWHILMGTPYELIELAYLVPAARTQYRSIDDLLGRPIAPEDRRFLATRIIRMAHGIWREEKALTEDQSLCFNCDAKAVCERWNRPVHIEAGRMKVPF
jgi:hypothetical protein